MKHLSELRTMIEDITTPQHDEKLSQQPQSVSVAGDNNVIVVYAAGPVTINSYQAASSDTHEAEKH